MTACNCSNDEMAIEQQLQQWHCNLTTSMTTSSMETTATPAQQLWQ